jgi:hypothetical protein
VWIRYPLGERVEARVVEDRGAWPGDLDRAIEEMRGEARDAVVSVARLEAGGSLMWLGLALPPGSTLSVETAARSPRYGVVEESPVVVARIAPAPLVRAWSVLLSPGPPEESAA